MSRMRQTVTHTTSTQDHESNLDALLEDLQTTVSRSNSQLNLNGTMTTGYREVRRTVTDTGPHAASVNEYQIEYLNPANTTHHVVEANHSYNGTPAQRVYKESSYNYRTSEHASRGDAKLKQNISELDSLLDDLNTAQKKNFSESTAVTRHTSGIDSGLLEPVISSTPQGRVVEEKHYREEKVVRGRSTSPRRELVFTGPRSRDPSPITPVRQQQIYRYEKTTTSRTTAPLVTDVPAFDANHGYRSTNLAIEDNSLRGRSPSPAGSRVEYLYSNTMNSTNSRDSTPQYPVERTKYRDQHDAGEYSPQRYTSGKQTSSYSYSNTSTSRESRSRDDVPRSPPPHRSPSPVSFTQPPVPNSKPKGPYTYDPPPPPQSPQPTHKYYPERQPTQPQTVVSSYKYSSTSSSTNNYNTSNHYPEDAPLLPRPFPAPSPTPEQQEQQPPKRLDDLMASFSDTEMRNRHNNTVHRYEREREMRDHRESESVTQNLLPNGKDREKIIEKDKQIVKKEESKNVQGPPVYYPPGVELFSKKEESMAMQQSGGGMYKAKAKYEYESKSKSKSKESSGKAVVPVCLPLCCAMPCTIM